MYIVCGRFLLANWVRFYFLKTAGCTQCVSNIQKLNFSTTKTPDFLIMQQNCLKNKLKENCKQISECLTLKIPSICLLINLSTVHQTSVIIVFIFRPFSYLWIWTYLLGHSNATYTVTYTYKTIRRKTFRQNHCKPLKLSAYSSEISTLHRTF